MGQRQLLELAQRYVTVSNRVGKAVGTEEKKRLLRTELLPLCALPRMVMFGESDARKITDNLTAFFAERFPTVYYEVHDSEYAPLSREAIENTDLALRAQWTEHGRKIGLADVEAALSERAINFRFRRFYDDVAGERVSVVGAEFLLFDEADRIRMIAYTEPVGDPQPGAENAGT
jgi:hypothetical protein